LNQINHQVWMQALMDWTLPIYQKQS